MITNHQKITEMAKKRLCLFPTLFFFFLYCTGKLQKEMTTSYSERHVAKAPGRLLS